jgi:hypothetical protein
MKEMESEAKSILVDSARAHLSWNFNAFDIADETTDRYVCKVNLNQSEHSFKLGRLLISNRMKPFRLTVARPKKQSQNGVLGFRILLSCEDPSFTPKKDTRGQDGPQAYQEYLLPPSKSKMTIPVPIDPRGRRQFAYFKISILEKEEDGAFDNDSDEVNFGVEALKQDNPLQFRFHFGAENYNAIARKAIQYHPSRERLQQ